MTKHDQLMDEYEAIYKRSEEVYQEVTQGGYTVFKQKKEHMDQVMADKERKEAKENEKAHKAQ